MKQDAPLPLDEPSPGSNAQPPKVHSISQSLLIACAAYAIAQAANFLFQLRLLQQLGTAQYAETGLVHLLLVTVIFLADLGYSSLFLREISASSDWQRLWRQAMGHRLIATFVLLAASAFGWQLWGGKSGSRDYLLWAAPACLFALCNYSAPMIAQGRRVTGLLVAQVAWPSALLIWCLLPDSPALSTAAMAGLSVSLGYLLQAMVSVGCSRQLRLWLPLAGKGQINSALHLSLMGVCGTLHDRLTPFLLAPLAPSFLPFFLILNHILSGLAGIQAQLCRLLLPAASTQSGRARIINAASLMLWATALLLLLAGAYFQERQLLASHVPWSAMAATVVLAWSLSASSGFLVTLLISERKERPLLKLLSAGLFASALLQMGAALSGDPSYLLWARLLGMLVILVCVLGLLKLRPGLGGWTALCLSLVACAITEQNLTLVVVAVMVLPALVGLLRQTPCYLPARGAEVRPCAV